MRFLTIFICIVLASCSRSLAPHEAAADQQIFSFAKKMNKKEQMTLFSFGGSAQNKHIQIFGCNLCSTKQLDLTEARELYISTVNAFLKQINENEKIRPYLENYPATVDNLDLGIIFWGSNHTRLPTPYIAKVSFAHGKIFYSTWSKEKDTYERVKIEPWDEAVKIAVADESSKITD